MRMDHMLKDRSIAVLGAGKLGETLIRGLLDAGVVEAGRITVPAAHPPRVERMRSELGVEGTLSNADAVAGADIVVLAVKPQQVAAVLADVGAKLRTDQLLISVAASVGTAYIEKHL